jgi:dienelactone hydrolase
MAAQEQQNTETAVSAPPESAGLQAAASPVAPATVPGNKAPPTRKRKRGIGQWAARVTLAALLLLGFFLSAVPLGRAITRAAILIPGLLSVSEPTPLVVAGEEISHTSTTIYAQNGPVFLDVYAPTSAPPPVPGSREAVVMIPGVGDNRTDPQLINLSESLARAGIVAVNMTTPALIGFNLTPADTDAIVQAFLYAARLPGVNPAHVGIVGFSGGSVMACRAAADPRIRDQVAFITLFGTLFNATNVLRYFGQRAVTVDGQTQPFHPYATAMKVMSTIIAGTLPPAEGTKLLNALAPDGKPLQNPEQELPSPGAAAAYHLLAGDDPAHADANIAALSPAMKDLLTALSPSTFLDQIHTTVYLLHDHNDPAIPSVESRDFAAALAQKGHPHDFVEFGIFHHTEITNGFGLGPLLADGSQLYRILTKVALAGS